MSKEKGQPKIGSGHLSAMWRQGLAELRAAMYPGSNVAQPAQYGIYGTRTPGEVADARKAELSLDRDEEPKSSIEERLRSPKHEREAREPEPPCHEPE